LLGGGGIGVLWLRTLGSGPILLLTITGAVRVFVKLCAWLQMLLVAERCARMQVLCGGVGCDGDGRRVTGLYKRGSND